MLNLLAKRDDFYEFMQHTILIIDSAIKFIEKWIQRQFQSQMMNISCKALSTSLESLERWHEFHSNNA